MSSTLRLILCRVLRFTIGLVLKVLEQYHLKKNIDWRCFNAKSSLLHGYDTGAGVGIPIQLFFSKMYHLRYKPRLLALHLGLLKPEK